MEQSDYDKELELFCKARGIWDDKKKKPTRFVINRLKTVDRKHADGYIYKENVHDGFTTHRPIHIVCQYCSWELEGRKGKKYCNDKCKDNHRRLKERFKELQKLGASLIIIPRNPEGTPRWKDWRVIFVGENGQRHEQPLTNKNGKPRKLSELYIQF